MKRVVTQEGWRRLNSGTFEPETVSHKHHKQTTTWTDTAAEAVRSGPAMTSRIFSLASSRLNVREDGIS